MTDTKIDDKTFAFVAQKNIPQSGQKGKNRSMLADGERGFPPRFPGVFFKRFFFLRFSLFFTTVYSYMINFVAENQTLYLSLCVPTKTKPQANILCNVESTIIGVIEVLPL